MYDNQMSVFSQQMDCEPKLQECNKKTDGLKQQVLTCSLSPARVVILRAPRFIKQISLLFSFVLHLHVADYQVCGV